MSNPNGDGWNSAEDAAVLEAFESGGLDAVSNDVAPNNSVTEAEMENFIESTAKEMEDLTPSESEEPATEEESSDGEEELEVEGETEEADSSDGEEEVETELFVEGPSGKKIKVDLNPDRDKLVKLHQAADRARLYQSQLDKMKHESSKVAEQMEELQETSNLFNQLEELSEDLDVSDPSSFNDMISVLTEGQVNMDQLIEKALEERDYLGELSDDALALYDKQKEIKRERRELEKAKARKERDEQRAQSEHKARIAEEQKTMVYNAFNKYADNIRGALDNPGREEKILEKAWNESLRQLKGYDQVTPELADKIFKEEIEFFAGPIKSEVPKQVNKAVRKKSAQATKKVQQAVAPKARTTREEIEAMSWEEAIANLGNIKL